MDDEIQEQLEGSLHVTWQFTNYLNPGRYFLDFFVTSIEDHQKNQIISIPDAIVFEVLDYKNRVAYGFFDLQSFTKVKVYG